MPIAVITGSGGLIGSESVAHFVRAGYDVVGVENDMRSEFFGPTASTRSATERLVASFPEFRSLELDVRDADGIDALFARHGSDLALVVHTAAQPSHDWAASAPHVDFGVNATGTLNLLEATRSHAPEATFIFTSTNKVYGDTPNHLPLLELETRLELPAEHRYFGGIDTSMSIDHSMHSLFGVSKAAADLMVQEYGRYFDMPTVCFRAGCLTGPTTPAQSSTASSPTSCAARSPAIPTRSSATAGARSATTSTAPISSPRSRRSIALRAPPPSTTSEAAGTATAR